MSESNLKSMQDLASLCKRRGFIFQSSEIYGGLGSCYDMGPIGAELKNNIKNAWWKSMTFREDVVGLGGRRVPGRCDRPSTGMDALVSGRSDVSAWSEGPGR